MNHSITNDIDQIEAEMDDAFSYDGYQVVRGEFFAHLREPAVVFSENRVSVNSACLRKLPDTDYIQILVNPEEKKLAVRPCDEDQKDAFRWSTSGRKKTPRKIRCEVFFAKVMDLMNWNPAYRYKLLGKLIRSNDELLFVFDLNTPSVFIRITKDSGKEGFTRKAKYPDEWKNQFGISVEEHRRRLQVNVFSGYAVFGLTAKENTEKKEGEINEQKPADTGDQHRLQEEPNTHPYAYSAYDR